MEVGTIHVGLRSLCLHLRCLRLIGSAIVHRRPCSPPGTLEGRPTSRQRGPSRPKGSGGTTCRDTKGLRHSRVASSVVSDCELRVRWMEPLGSCPSRPRIISLGSPEARPTWAIDSARPSALRTQVSPASPECSPSLRHGASETRGLQFGQVRSRKWTSSRRSEDRRPSALGTLRSPTWSPTRTLSRRQRSPSALSKAPVSRDTAPTLEHHPLRTGRPRVGMAPRSRRQLRRRTVCPACVRRPSWMWPRRSSGPRTGRG